MSARFRTLAAAPLALAVTLLTAAPAQASAIYTYTGPLFTTIDKNGPATPTDPYQTSDRITGSFTMEKALAPNLGPLTLVTPLSYSFTDGVNTLTELNTTFRAFRVTTDATGAIVGWDINVYTAILPGGGGQIQSMRTVYRSIPGGGSQAQDFAFDQQCATASRPGFCALDTSGYYAQSAQRNVTMGTWEVENTTPVVPEPTSLLLVGAALAGLAARRRVR